MDIVNLLQSAYAVRVNRNAGYSLRAFARDLGISAAGLSQILSGRQGISPVKAKLLGKKLGLNGEELEALVLEATQAYARSSMMRQAAEKEIRRRKKESPSQVLTLELFHAISDWWHWTLIEVAQLEKHASVESLAASAAQRIGMPAAVLEESLRRLLRLEILGRSENGIKPRKDTRIVPSGVPSEAIRKLHGQMLEKAKDALAFQSTEERDFGASFVSIDPQALPLLKERLRKFRREMIEEFGQNSENPNAQIYCLGTQAFRIDT